MNVVRSVFHSGTHLHLIVTSAACFIFLFACNRAETDGTVDPISAKTASKSVQPSQSTPEATVEPKLQGLFMSKKKGVLKVLDGIEFGAPVESLTAISATLGKGKRWTVPGFDGVTIQAYLSANPKTLRYWSVGLPKGFLAPLERAWGKGQRAQLNGRRNGIFWFDDEKGLQVSMPDHPQSTRLTIGPFTPLESLLAPAGDGNGHAVARFIGQLAKETRAKFVKTMDRPQGKGFIAWVKPVRYHTHPIGLRMVVDQERVVAISFPLSGFGHDGSLSYLIDLLSSRWGKAVKVERAPNIDDPYRWTWQAAGSSLALTKSGGVKAKPPRQRLMVSLVAEGYEQPLQGPVP